MLIPIALALPLLLASAPRGTDLDALLRQHAAAAAASESVEELWAAVGALTQTAGDERAALDGALDRALSTGTALDARAVLLFVAARLAGEEPDVAALAKRLTSLFAERSEDLARAAAGVLCDTRFRALSEEELTDVTGALAALARDNERAPETRIEAAVAQHTLGRAAAQRTARTELVSYLSSSDPRLRGLGALALARTGDVETGRTDLERLAATPSAEGRLAQSFLKQEELRRLYDRRQKNLLEYAKEKSEGVDLKGSREARLLEQTMRLIETTSLEGEMQTRQKLLDAALDGMLRSLDEHSSLLTPKAYLDNFAEDLLEPEYGGIGAYVGKDPEDGLFTIRQPIYSGPAYKMGLHSEDKIVRIEDWPTYTAQGSKPLDEIIKRLKGKPGTPVKLYIWRRGMDTGLIDRPTEDMAVVVMRERVTIPPMKTDLLPGGVGLVQLDTFSNVAAEEVAKAVTELKRHGLKSLVLDLRQNTGGLLTQARDVANLFLPKGKLVVSTESRAGEPRRLFTTKDPVVPEDVPVVVLISRFSASASEIVAGALQDHQRAVVVGQRSYGKGSVQELLPIPGERDDVFEDLNGNGRRDEGEPLTKDWNQNGEFDIAPRARLTVARYRLPSGRSIHRERGEDGTLLSEGGVEPAVKADPIRLEPAVITEMRRVVATKKIRAWLDQAWASDRDELVRLGECDFDDPARYPGFDGLYASLETSLTPQQVRALVRREVRGRAQDVRGSAFPDGDFQDDPMLQAAIAAALERLSLTPADVPQYAATFQERAQPEDRPLLTANLTDSQRSDLRHALTLLGESGAAIGADQLAQIRRALQAVLDK
ncbi:MAG: hypothetical protein JNK02_01435 [Planctomycetes bacterium]|nr:hypothetical protein [Planctomycetota bacterium]